MAHEYIDDNGEEIPFEHTSDCICPDCGSVLHPANPADPACDNWHCSECGFNEPNDETD